MDVDAVKWSLCHDRAPFFSSALSGLKLAMTRNEDNSGRLSNFLLAQRLLGIRLPAPANLHLCM